MRSNDIPGRAVFRARLPVRKNFKFSHYSSVTYYFDEDMVELGYTVSGYRQFFDQTEGREWSAEAIEPYFVQRMGTNEIIQEGRK